MHPVKKCALGERLGRKLVEVALLLKVAQKLFEPQHGHVTRNNFYYLLLS
jgi:hypothetical protein